MSASLMPVHRAARSGEKVWVVGDCYTFLLTGAETGGALALFHFLVPPGSGSPPHTHSREDETFYVLKGTIEFTAGGRVIRAVAGETVFGPRGVPHSFRNVGDGDAEMTCAVTPAGLEVFFRDAGSPVDGPEAKPPPPSEEDRARMAKAAPHYGITLGS